MKFNLREISGILNAELRGKNNSFASPAIDSRSIGIASETLFVAIKTSRNNGHKYTAELYEKGVRSFLVSEPDSLPEKFPLAGFIVCADTLDALQQLAAYKRSLFRKEVVAVTGSNGKTVVKEWLYQLMQHEHDVCRSPKSYNSQIGVPLSVWQLEERHDLGIFEAGISEPGEMVRLEKIIHPHTGIITNIKAAHDENFSSRKQKAEEKLNLFVRCKKILFCSAHKEISAALGGKKFSRAKKISWGRKNGDALKITAVKRTKSGTAVKANYKGKSIECSFSFTDEASFENALHCWLFLLEKGYKPALAAERIAALSPVAMRLEMKRAIGNSSLVNDSYNSDIESLAIALDFLNRQHQHPKKTVILSDIFQTGKEEKKLYTEVARLIKAKKITRFIGVGPALTRNKNLFSGGNFFKSTDEFLNTLSADSFNNEAILLKGAREFQFEKIGTVLQQKSHDTVLEISLNNVVHNLNYYRSLLKSGTGVMGMVKAFSYGSGSYEIAGALQHHNVQYLAVAYADEGVELRSGGIKLPVMVMNPEPQGFSDLIEYGLEPEIFSHRIFDLYSGFISGYKGKKGIPGIHIKIDTGMHRLGFEEHEIDLLVKKLKANRGIRVASVFSHLAASDEPHLRDFTLQQLTLFRNAAKKIEKAIGYKPLLHICNSAAIARFPEAHFDLVRLGIGMYGVGADLQEQAYLLNAGKWKTTISQIKKLKPGETVGYSRKGTVSKPTVIATVPVGYADGFARKYGNGRGCMYIHGKKAPVIGNVCMDMCMLDITDINAKEGEEVIIFDSPETLNALAKMGETIPYEILTSISPRVKRIYLEE